MSLDSNSTSDTHPQSCDVADESNNNEQINVANLPTKTDIYLLIIHVLTLI